jgi:hypothetical protein
MLFSDILSVSEFLSCSPVVLTMFVILAMWIRHGELRVSNLEEINTCTWSANVLVNLDVDSRSTHCVDESSSVRPVQRENLQNKHACILLSTSIKI